ncbi:MAG: alanine dehydrogenase [Planctomycetes bacterium]|nr:alanine dehydrogenase [Planctomycetota bacterium]
MKIGIPREIKADEYRVAIVPAGVDALVRAGHAVLIEKGAGDGSGIEDAAYERAGASIIPTREDLFGAAELILKVKEPQEEEFKLIQPGHIMFTYFHFASSRALTEAMTRSKATCIAYETVERPDTSLPLLTPMSEVAGRMAVQEGAKFLEKPMEGRGILLAGVPGVAPAIVVIIGGGVVGSNAARIAAGLGARVYILDINLNRLRYLSEIMPPNVVTLMSNPYNLSDLLRQADLVIGAILIPGAKAPKLIRRSDLKSMKRRAVLVDVAIDQGGCAETSRPTTHSKPIYIEEDIVHYCVTNIPGAVGTTSTYALTNVTLPYVLDVANKGWAGAARDGLAIRKGLNVIQGRICHAGVADAFGLSFTPVENMIA